MSVGRKISLMAPGGSAEGLHVKQSPAAYARTLEKAIRAKCLDCCGGMRSEVRGCNVKYCPLWPFRSSGTGSILEKEKPSEASGLEGQISLFEEMRA